MMVCVRAYICVEFHCDCNIIPGIVNYSEV